MKKIKYILIILSIIMLIVVAFYTTTHLKSVERYVKIYSSNTWKINSTNGIRVAYLRYMNNQTYLNYKLDISISCGSFKKKLLTKNIDKKLFNGEIFIDNSFPEGKCLLNVNLKSKGEKLEEYKIGIELVKNYLQPKNLTFYQKKDNENITYSIFPTAIDGKIENKYYIFSSLKEIIPFEKQRIYFLNILSDHTPISGKKVINLKNLSPKLSSSELTFDNNGLFSKVITPYRAEGKLIIDSKDEIFFEGKFLKNHFAFKNFFLKNDREINIPIKLSKKFDKLFCSVFSGDLWLFNKIITFNSREEICGVKLNNNFTGFLDIVIHKQYNYGDHLYKTKVFIGDKESLKKELLKMDIPYINNVISSNSDNDQFYNFIISQLSSPFKNPPQLFDSYPEKKLKIDNWKKRYKNILWWIVFFISILILISVFIWVQMENSYSKKNIDYDFQKKGGHLILYIVIVVLAAFFGLLLFILKIV